jgi:copper chaperone CopZ
MVVAVVVLLCSVRLAGGADANARTERVGKGGWLTNRFSITGMHCKDCAKGLTAELKLTPGVVKAVVSIAETMATVVYDSKRVESSGLLKAIQEAGFRGALITNAPAGRAAAKSEAGSAHGIKAASEHRSP